jgi:uncharacterized protein YjbI with pentapeptide repeats
MKKNIIIERWQAEPHLRLVFNKITELLKKGGKIQLEAPLLERMEGKIDLRGIGLDEKKIVNSEFNNFDFSFSTFTYSWIENSIFEKCHFYKVDFSNFSDHQNSFKECYFIDCKFTKTIFTRPEFVNVVFRNCRIINIDFSASSFESCTFEGKLKDVWFRGGFPLQSDNISFGNPKKNEMKNVSFENAELEDLTFSDNCDLSTIKINSSNIYYLFNRWKERLELLKLEHLNWDDKDKKEAGIFTRVHLVHAIKQDWYIINRNDVERDYGKEVAVRILKQLNSL